MPCTGRLAGFPMSTVEERENEKHFVAALLSPSLSQLKWLRVAEQSEKEYVQRKSDVLILVCTRKYSPEVFSIVGIPLSVYDNEVSKRSFHYSFLFNSKIVLKDQDVRTYVHE